uniref:Uncharacterized protein n=1 Tax=Anguilla anguilla TaxID=7936 RepID=A0A0E9ST23_ANGAN
MNIFFRTNYFKQMSLYFLELMILQLRTPSWFTEMSED